MHSLPDLEYGVAEWNPDDHGNHRAVIRVDHAAEAVRVCIPWRRRDGNPQGRDIHVVDGRTSELVDDVVVLDIDRERGHLAFRPASGPGTYYVYFMPYAGNLRSNYPKIEYPPPRSTASPAWRRQHGLGADADLAGPPDLPEARVLRLESVSEWNRFTDMERIATAAERETLLARHLGQACLVFPEDRRHPIRMTADIPSRWLAPGAAGPFIGAAARGEFYAYQLGVYAARQDLTDVRISFQPLSMRDGGPAVGPEAMRCFNLGGTDWTGHRFDRRVDVPQGRIRALWCGVQIPVDQPPGTYHGTVQVAAAGLEPTSVRLQLEVGPEQRQDAGDDEPWRHSRLRWLDSTLALEGEVTPPFKTLRVDGRRIRLLGRELSLTPDGLPEQIRSSFTSDMTRADGPWRALLAEPCRLVFQRPDGTRLHPHGPGMEIDNAGPAKVSWRSTSRTNEVSVEIQARLDFDGTAEFAVLLQAKRRMRLADVRLEMPLLGDAAPYLMGMGHHGGPRPDRFHWHWEQAHNQDSAWLGDVNIGVQVTLRDESYTRPLNTNFYQLKPLRLPRSWHNEGRGEVRIEQQADGTCLVTCGSGSLTLSAGEQRHFNFRLLLTPFKALDTAAHFSQRYYHAYVPPEQAAAAGATVINIHHACDINPYINYPFLRVDEMRKYVAAAHAVGLRVKIYYTVRELANRAAELFALRSLDDEILADGPGGGCPWLQEHLGDHYIAGWFVPHLQDAALITSGTSRWHNYYLEGLHWLARHVGIDGLYIDDLAFDRVVMQRARRILQRHRPAPLIDLHSANQFNERDGFASSTNLYLEHFPYLDRLWFGEYFDYDSPPHYWLTEISGIPFGLMGEMLQGGGNPWRGMLYGMTARLPGNETPRHLWPVWDRFGIGQSRMLGYWASNCPVRTDCEAVLATVYAGPGRALMALASWAPAPVDVRLAIDWRALGLDPARCVLTASPIKGFQRAARFAPDAPIPVSPGKGWLLTLHTPRRRGPS